MVITWLPVWVQVGPSLYVYFRHTLSWSRLPVCLAGVLYTVVWLLWCVKVQTYDPFVLPDFGV